MGKMLKAKDKARLEGKLDEARKRYDALLAENPEDKQEITREYLEFVMVVNAYVGGEKPKHIAKKIRKELREVDAWLKTKFPPHLKKPKSNTTHKSAGFKLKKWSPDFCYILGIYQAYLKKDDGEREALIRTSNREFAGNLASLVRGLFGQADLIKKNKKVSVAISHNSTDLMGFLKSITRNNTIIPEEVICTQENIESYLKGFFNGNFYMTHSRSSDRPKVYEKTGRRPDPVEKLPGVVIKRTSESCLLPKIKYLMDRIEVPCLLEGVYRNTVRLVIHKPESIKRFIKLELLSGTKQEELEELYKIHYGCLAGLS
ncbi:hypothetical protein KY317_01455 [Candidatus Woesearchaeota archaeon]|nr:hypothetical protein [Candidatus Woesearchaeota archaeon]